MFRFYITVLIAAFLFSAHDSSASPFTVDTSTLYVSGGQVGIGTISPSGALDVYVFSEFGNFLSLN
jgi:hypothetical protein